MKTSLEPESETSQCSENATGKAFKWQNAKLISFGITPTGYISIGIVPMGVIAIGIVPMGVISIGTVAMGAIASGFVSMGIFAFGGVSMSWFNGHQGHQQVAPITPPENPTHHQHQH